MSRVTAFRHDVEGLRAVGLCIVVAAHIQPALFPGGFSAVDIFFVISGYLITQLLVAELERTGRIDMLGFYARRAKRLLPAAGFVLACVLVLTFAVLPPTRWASTGWDVVAAACYVVNWRFAAESVDYLAADRAPSIVQHYWSLSVEEQVYLIWPVLLIGAGLLVRRRFAVRTGVLVVLGTITVASLAWSVYLTEVEPGTAYVATTTRLWQITAGGIVAMLVPELRRLPRRLAVPLGWAGLAAIVGAARLFTSADAYPGYLALAPTLGTAAIIAAGIPSDGTAGVGRLIGTRPFRMLGALMYPMYLWQWPLLVAVEAYRVTESGPETAAAVSAVALLLAALTNRFVEEPMRRARFLSGSPWRAIRVGVACTTVPALVAVAFPLLVPPSWPTVRPDPVMAERDMPDAHRDRCLPQPGDTTVRRCVYGDPAGAFTVAIVGDSHAATWLPAFQELAAPNGWRLVTYLKSSCPLLDEDVIAHDRLRSDCRPWTAGVRDALAAGPKPDLLVTTSARYTVTRDGRPLPAAQSDAAFTAGLRRVWSELAATGVPTVVLADVPVMRVRVPECVSAHLDRLTRCASPRAAAIARSATALQFEAARDLPGVTLVDLNDAVCPADPCAPVISEMLVYRDSNHLTATYMRSLAPRLAAALGRPG